MDMLRAISQTCDDQIEAINQMISQLENSHEAIMSDPNITKLCILQILRNAVTMSANIGIISDVLTLNNGVLNLPDLE